MSTLRVSHLVALLVGGTALTGSAAVLPHDSTNDWNVAEGDASVAANYTPSSLPGANTLVRISNGGTMTVSSDLTWGALWAGTYVQGYGNATVKQSAGHLTLTNSGSASGDGTLRLGHNTSTLGHYILTGGILETFSNPHISGNGIGCLTISGGEAIFNPGYPSIGRSYGGFGHIDVSGTGLLTAPSVYQLTVGEDGLGSLTIRDGGTVDARKLMLGFNANGSGTLNVCSGGVLKVSALSGGNGSLRQVNAQGGTIRAKAGGSADGFLAKTDLRVGSGGLRFDTDGYDTRIATPLLGGTLSASDLVHRWSFNGTLTDSIGGYTAVLQGDNKAQITYEGNMIRLPGAAHATAYVSLGKGIIPANCEGVTIEIWSTPMGKGTWSRLFTCNGKNKASNGFIVLNSDFYEAKTGDGTGTKNNGVGAFNLGQASYFVLRFTRAADKTWTLDYIKQDGLTGGLLKALTKTGIASTYEPADFAGDRFNLGWSTDSGNDDANIRFDEVRVWKRSLSNTELLTSATLGPDADFSAAPAFVKSGAGLLVLTNGNDYAGATTIEKGQLAAAPVERPSGRWSFNGSYADSIASRTATLAGSEQDKIVLGETFVTLPGAEHDKAHIELGGSVWSGVSDAFTLEFWARQNTALLWARLFTIRANTYTVANQPRLFMTLVDGTNPDKDAIGVQGGDTAGWLRYVKIAPWTLGQWFHVAVVGRRQNDGRWEIGFRKHDVATGACLKTYTELAPTGWSPTTFVDGTFGLGWSTDAGNYDAAASFDEVRVWSRALSDDELVESTLLGPDTLPVLGTAGETGVLPPTTDLRIAQGGVFALANAAQSVQTLTGEGSVQGGGTLTVTEAIRPGGADQAGTLTLTAGAKIAGTCEFDTGDTLAFAPYATFDVSQIKIKVVHPEAIVIGSPVKIISAANATLTGSFDLSDPSLEGLRLRRKANGDLVLARPAGMTMYIR